MNKLAGTCRWWLRLLPLALLGLSTPGELCGQQQGPAPVEVMAVRRETLAGGKTYLGDVLPRRRSVVGSAVDGRVERMLVDAGDRVLQAGDPLAQLRTATIEIELAAARAEEKLRQRELDEMASVLPQQKEQAQAKLKAAEALKAYRQAQFERTKSLVDRNSASREELEEAVSARVAAEQAYLVAEADVMLASDETQQAKLDQAQARLEGAQEEVLRLEDRLEKYTVRAPFTGYVSAKFTEVGAWIQTGDPVAEVIELDPVEVEVAVPEVFAARLRRGDTARVHLEALPDQLIPPGSVDRIVPQADIRSRTFPVRIVIPNPYQPGKAPVPGPLAEAEDAAGSPQRTGYHPIQAGMLAEVTLEVGESSGEGLLVHKDALVLGGAQPLVYAVQDDGKVAAVPLQLGVARGQWIEVIVRPAAGQPGLQEGTLVVTRGNERLRPGQEVSVLKQNPPADAAD